MAAVAGFSLWCLFNLCAKALIHASRLHSKEHCAGNIFALPMFAFMGMGPCVH